MPSRPLSPIPSPSPSPQHHRPPTASHLIPPITAAAFSCLLIFAVCFRKKFILKRTVPSDSKPPHRFSYSTLRRATSSFSPSLRLGQGGFGSVFRGSLPDGHVVAVKVMDSGSLQGEREFQNELLFASKLDSPFVVTAIGFSSDRKHRSMLLIYELMPNGNLQDALLHRKCPELFKWEKRLRVAVEIAKGISYLHSLDPPAIHGDIKPSNILLDQSFSAKLADFGLAWLKSENQCEIKVDESDLVKVNGGSELKKTELETNNGGFPIDDYGSVVETESVTTEFNFGIDQSPESFLRTSPETVEVIPASPETIGGGGAVSEANFDGASVASGKESSIKKGREVKSASGRHWWWKQDHNTGTAENGVVKDYVMEWIGTEIKKERPKSNWIGSSSSNPQLNGKPDKKKNRKRLDWWVSLDDEKEDKILKKEKRRQPREWWKEEYCEELERKKKKKKKKKRRDMNVADSAGEDWWPRDDEMYSERKKKKRSRSRSSRGSMDWFSGELFRGALNSHDSISGEIPKSGGISSTPSMRGTVCYVAPEYGGGGGSLSEKSDVYSYGVLLLVLIAGRRPLQVTNSPMSEFHRANLIHWARHLARAGKLLDLVDEAIECLDSEEAHLCIIIALLCLQKLPARRPTMKEVVGMLTRELEPPQLPIEFSPSPPFKSRSHRKIR
ncbi:Protein kinase superfamily protein [Euphorbia peplus]|nr:Protein kinase superfamily protein [Euphorbia peplus]